MNDDEEKPDLAAAHRMYEHTTRELMACEKRHAELKSLWQAALEDLNKKILAA